MRGLSVQRPRTLSVGIPHLSLSLDLGMGCRNGLMGLQTRSVLLLLPSLVRLGVLLILSAQHHIDCDDGIRAEDRRPTIVRSTTAHYGRPVSSENATRAGGSGTNGKPDVRGEEQRRRRWGLMGRARVGERRGGV